MKTQQLHDEFIENNNQFLYSLGCPNLINGKYGAIPWYKKVHGGNNGLVFTRNPRRYLLSNQALPEALRTRR
jgi:hypothetical protein